MEENEKAVEGPEIGSLTMEELKRVLGEFRKLTRQQQLDILEQTAIEDLYAKLLMGQASHQDTGNIIKLIRDSGNIAPPPTKREQVLIEEQGKQELPNILPDYSEDEDE